MRGATNVVVAPWRKDAWGVDCSLGGVAFEAVVEALRLLGNMATTEYGERSLLGAGAIETVVDAMKAAHNLDDVSIEDIV